MNEVNDAVCASVYNSSVDDLEYSPLPSDKLPVGSDVAISTGFKELIETDKLSAGLWEHPVGVSMDEETDEIFVILSGKGQVFVLEGPGGVESGLVLDLAPGTVGSLSRGTCTRWEISETLRKVYIMPK
jgi:uncharacterized cupin superfamily protein